MAFEFGVACGDVTASSAVLWARAASASACEWELENLDNGSRSGGTAQSTPEGFVHVGVTSLPPGTRWRYRFVDREIRSDWGHFRTLPVAGLIRFAVVSCAKYNSGYFNAYEAVAQRTDLDFVLHLGDYIYEAGEVPRKHQTAGADIGRPFDPLHDCVTYGDYSRRYAQYRRDPALRRLHQAHGIIFTLDDHEIADNAWVGGAEEHLSADGLWDERLRDALRAWEAWQPTLRNPSTGGRLWQVLGMGDAATLFLCDSRLCRTDPFAEDGPGKSILGVGQAAALGDVVGNSDDQWLMLGMPSKFLSLESARGDEDTDLVLRTLKLSNHEDKPYHDRWDAYSHERDRTLELLEQSRARPVIICGDVHFAAFSKTSSGRVAECVTTSVTSPNFDDKMGWLPGDQSRRYEEKLVARVPELDWCDLDRHGYLIIEVTRDTFACEWWGVPTVDKPTSESQLVHRVDLNRSADA